MTLSMRCDMRATSAPLTALAPGTHANQAQCLHVPHGVPLLEGELAANRARAKEAAAKQKRQFRNFFGRPGG